MEKIHNNCWRNSDREEVISERSDQENLYVRGRIESVLWRLAKHLNRKERGRISGKRNSRGISVNIWGEWRVVNKFENRGREDEFSMQVK